MTVRLSVRQAAELLLEVACPDCGPCELRTTGLHLVVFDHGHGSYAAFFCPGCTEEIRLGVDLEAQLTLVTAGVGVTEVAVPDEMLDPARSGPAISPDDVMEFALALRAGDAYAWLG